MSANDVMSQDEIDNLLKALSSGEVDADGIATLLIDFIKADALERGFKKLELNMWEFNESALAFYESVGFGTYRRDLEMFLTENESE